MAKEDTAGRCSNCIRLKKDCSFFPVETTDRRPRSSSKPDILNNDGGSTASSPSPRLGQGPVPEYPNGHPSSLPVTPISERPNSEDNCRANGAPGPSSRIQIPQSASESRRPSNAHLNSGPLGIKPEEAFIRLGESVPRTPWEVPSQQEMPNFGQYCGFEDPSTTYWRLNSPSICGGPHPQHPLHSVNSMASLTAPESLDSCEDGMYSPQGPSRMGSFDHSIGGVLGYPTTHSPEATDFGVVPDLRSANASTASLAASISEASQYGAPGEPGYEQHYHTTQWVDQTPNGVHFGLDMVKGEDVAMDSTYLLAMEEGYPMNGDFHHLVYSGQHARPIVKPDQE